MLATVAGGSSIEPIAIEFEEKPVEEVYKESMENIESKTLQSLLLTLLHNKKENMCNMSTGNVQNELSHLP